MTTQNRQNEPNVSVEFNSWGPNSHASYLPRSDVFSTNYLRRGLLATLLHSLLRPPEFGCEYHSG